MGGLDGGLHLGGGRRLRRRDRRGVGRHGDVGRDVGCDRGRGLRGPVGGLLPGGIRGRPRGLVGGRPRRGQPRPDPVGRRGRGRGLAGDVQGPGGLEDHRDGRGIIRGCSPFPIAPRRGVIAERRPVARGQFPPPGAERTDRRVDALQCLEPVDDSVSLLVRRC